MSISTSSPISHDLSGTLANEPMFFVVSIRKLIVMSIFTFGGYWAFCLYQSWAMYRRASGERVFTLVRAFFGVWFLYSLLSRVDRQISLSGRSYKWSPFWLVCAIVVLIVIPMWTHWFIELAPLFFLGALVAMDLARFYLLAKMQQGINFCEGDPRGESNARLSLSNWLWMSLGILGWAGITTVFVMLLLGVPMGL